MNKSKTILVTDADGTLLTDTKRVLEIDKAAIADFTAKGGLFTVATGRGVAAACSVVEAVGADLLKLPLILFNGAAVYDFERNKFLWKCGLSADGMDYVLKLKERFPDVGMEVLVDEDVYVTSTNEFEEMHLDFAGIEPIRCPFDEVPKNGWIKVLIIDVPEMIDEVVKFCADNPCESVHVVRSSGMYFEVLPKGVNKWTGIEKLLQIIGGEREDYRVIAAGDYMNDIEMIKHSDIGIATANAENIVKDAADFIVCDNNSGIVNYILRIL